MLENYCLKDYCGYILRITKQLIEQDLDQIIEGKRNLHLPIYKKVILEELAHKVKDLFSEEPNILEIDHDVTIVGDLHGHLFDLLRILYRFGFPPYTNYLFLGDLIDRGECSLEVVVIIFTLKYLFPGKVHIIRGNHEFVQISSSSTFSHQVAQLYRGSTTLLNSLFEAFSYLPLAAKVYQKNLCLHGGISPDFLHIEQIDKIKRPITTYSNNSVLCGLLWSDPSKICNEYGTSSRRNGFLFGFRSFDRFMKSNNFDLMIRGHECVVDGYKYEFDRRLVTVFSASNYCNKILNKSAVLQVNKDSVEPISMLPLGYVKRSSIRFFRSPKIEHLSKEQCSLLLSGSSPLSVMVPNSQKSIVTPKLLNMVKYRQRPASNLLIM